MNKNLQIAKNILHINQQFILKFEELLQDIKKHKRNCNIAKSVGTGVTVVGSGLAVAGVIVATIATGGIALAVVAPVLGWTGFGVGLAGSATNAGTEIADKVITSNRRKEIEDLQQKLKSELDRAPALVDNIIKLIETESSVAGKIFKTAADLTNDGLRLWAATGHLAKAASYSSTGGFIVATCGQNASAGKIFCTCITKSPLLRASVVSLIATGVELYFLYRSWTEPHELEKVIHDLIGKLQNLNKIFKLFIDGYDQKSDFPDFTNQYYEFRCKQS